MPPRGGAVLFGYCLDILLYGILTVQIYIYYLSFPNDRRMTKTTVAFVYVVGTLQTAFALHDFYSLFRIPDSHEDPVEFYKTWDDLRPFGFMWITIPLCGASVAAVSQLFYAHRIHVLSGKKLIPRIVTVLALLQLAVGIFVAFASYKNQALTGGLFISARLLDALAWELTGAICDLVITIYMFRFLSRRIQQSFRPTRISLTRIKRFTLESGLVTTAVALAYVLLSSLTNFGAFIIPGLALSKIYGNSILALLNSRLRIPGGRNELDSDYAVAHLTLPERQPELQQDDPGASVSLLAQPGLELDVYHSRQ